MWCDMMVKNVLLAVRYFTRQAETWMTIQGEGENIHLMWLLQERNGNILKAYGFARKRGQQRSMSPDCNFFYFGFSLSLQKIFSTINGEYMQWMDGEYVEDTLQRCRLGSKSTHLLYSSGHEPLVNTINSIIDAEVGNDSLLPRFQAVATQKCEESEWNVA